MSLKFQTRKWDVEITWEYLTLTPLGTTTSPRGTMSADSSPLVQTNNTNYFLFELIAQLFASQHKQEHLSQ
jgi:hypothetical protein